MTRSEHAANLQLAAAAQHAHVGAHFAKRGPVRRYAPAAAPVLASIIIRFA